MRRKFEADSWLFRVGRGRVGSSATLADEGVGLGASADDTPSQLGLQTCTMVSRSWQTYPRMELSTRCSPLLHWVVRLQDARRDLQLIQTGYNVTMPDRRVTYRHQSPFLQHVSSLLGMKFLECRQTLPSKIYPFPGDLRFDVVQPFLKGIRGSVAVELRLWVSVGDHVEL